MMISFDRGSRLPLEYSLNCALRIYWRRFVTVVVCALAGLVACGLILAFASGMATVYVPVAMLLIAAIAVAYAIRLRYRADCDDADVVSGVRYVALASNVAESSAKESLNAKLQALAHLLVESVEAGQDPGEMINEIRSKIGRSYGVRLALADQPQLIELLLALRAGKVDTSGATTTLYEYLLHSREETPQQ